jgi:hypothetical protein
MPHWEGLICGTGIAPFILEWHTWVLTNILAQDMHELDRFCTTGMAAIWEKYKNYQGREMSSTLYHLGYDRVEEKFVGWVYRSGAGFTSQELQPGIYLKPEPATSPEQISSFQDFITVAEKQKAEDRARPKEGRVGIGGKLISYSMDRIEPKSEEEEARIVTVIQTIHQFDDYVFDFNRAASFIQRPKDDEDR